MRQRVKPFTRWGGNTLSASMSGTGVVGAADPAAWNLPATINVAQGDSVGVRQYASNDDGWTIAVTGLATGLTYDSVNEEIDGAASGTASGTATFTLSKSGETDVVDTATVALVELGAWQLPTGHFTPAKMPMVGVHPRSFPAGSGGDETTAYARHKFAYPGIEYRIPISIQGGAYPFYYEILSGPAWLSIGQQIGQANYGILNGTAPGTAQAGETVQIKVTDQDLNEVTFEWTLTVTTSGFVFCHPSATLGAGDGTIGSPILFQEAVAPGAYPTSRIILRGGSHLFGGTLDKDGAYFECDGSSRPRIFIGYPGEDAIYDGTNGLMYIANDGGGGFFFGGLKYQNSMENTAAQRAFWQQSATKGTTIFESHFSGHRAATVARSNQGIYHTEKSPSGHRYITWWGCTCSDNYGRFIGSLYDTYYLVVEDCEVLAPLYDGEQTFIDMKTACGFVSARRNRSLIPGDATYAFQTRHGQSDSAFRDLYFESCYNILRVASGSQAQEYGGAPSAQAGQYNYNYSYRNTIIDEGYRVEGEVLQDDPSTPYDLLIENNVYITDSNYPNDSNKSNIIVGTGAQADLKEPLANQASVIDAEYKLIGSYRTTYLGTHGHEIA